MIPMAWSDSQTEAFGLCPATTVTARTLSPVLCTGDLWEGDRTKTFTGASG